MTVPHRIRKLYQIHKPSQKFETALDRFYDDLNHGRFVDRLHDAELEEFLSFLDEILQLEGLRPELFRKALLSLWSTCSKRRALPRSYVISEGLSRTGDSAVASGGYADVWMGELIRNSELKNVCIKAMRTPKQKGLEKIEQAWREEVSVWVRLKHPNIVKCLGATVNPLQIIVDWMPGGEVMEYLQKNPETDRLHFVLGMTQGLDYLHSRGVIHGDLKPSNILINAKGDACISDFGLAVVTRGKVTAGYEDSTTRGQSSMWAAPETLANAQVSKEADMFSYGLVVVGIFNGSSPWGQVTAAQIMTKILLGERPVRAEDANARGLTVELWMNLTKCWHEKPEDRITVSEILEYLQSTSRARSSSMVERTSLRRDTLGIKDDEQLLSNGGPPWSGSVPSISATVQERPRPVISSGMVGSPNKIFSISITKPGRSKPVASFTRRTTTFPTVRRSTSSRKASAFLGGVRLLSCCLNTDPDPNDTGYVP